MRRSGVRLPKAAPLSPQLRGPCWPDDDPQYSPAGMGYGMLSPLGSTGDPWHGGRSRRCARASAPACTPARTDHRPPELPARRDAPHAAGRGGRRRAPACSRRGRPTSGPARDRRGLLDRWTEVVDHELSTASTTAGYVRRTIRPALSDMPLRKLQHRVDILDRLYTHLRRCNRPCDSSPARKAVDKAAADGPHVCRPMSPGAVRRVHAILSAPLNYAVSWGWIERNPADYAHRPKLARRRALPPRPEQVAELLNAAAAADEELAMFLWLAVTSGARRGELVALRWTDVAFDRGLLRFATNYVVRGGQRRLKGTKTDDERWLSVDAFSVQVLETLRSARAAALVPSGLPLPVDAFVFSPDPLGQRPWHPDHFTHAHSAARSGSAGPWRRPRRPAGRRGSPRRRRGRRRTGRTRARSSGC